MKATTAQYFSGSLKIKPISKNKFSNHTALLPEQKSQTVHTILISKINALELQDLGLEIQRFGENSGDRVLQT